MTRVIICGGRDFDNKDLLVESLDKILHSYKDVEIVTGGAKGADTLGDNYAMAKAYPRKVFYANWKAFGKTAGYIRNGRMLEYAQEETPVVVAFWDGKSRGTKHMIDIAKSGGATVHIVNY